MKTHRPALALVLALSLSGSACMGSFVLTRKLYDFNSTITGNKILNNLIFWALLILPVYNIAILGDAVILNLIEFWTGSNPLAANDVERLDDGGLRLVRDGDVLEARPLDETHVLLLKNGATVGTLQLRTDGSLLLSDAVGSELASLSQAQRAAAEPTLAAAIPLPTLAQP